MQHLYDYKQFAILYVDDEEMSLKYFTRAFEDQFRIFTAATASEGVALMEKHKHEIGLLMSDQRMPGENGVWLLEQARKIQPSAIRILATAYSDLDAAIAAVNSGAIYKYITKPWELNELEATLKRGLEFFIVERERDQLLREKMSVLHDLLTDDRIISLGLMTAGMSHHIRNALVPVKTFLDLLPEQIMTEKTRAGELRNPEFWNDYYQQAVEELRKIRNLLSDLWNASERQTFNFSDCILLGDLLEKVLTDMRPKFGEKNIRVQLRIPEDLPAMTVDQPKFSRLFELLLQDEWVTLPEGSNITISAKAIREGAEDDSHIQVEVTDDGPGLPQENLRFVFDPFVARSDSPMEYGINLMACYFIVYHHGGRIGAESQEGQGTTFTMRFLVNPNFQTAEKNGNEAARKLHLNGTLWEKTLAGS